MRTGPVRGCATCPRSSIDRNVAGVTRMRVLVTGGAGFIGSAVCRHLVSAQGWDVCNLDKLTYASNLSSLDPIKDHPCYRFVRADICDGAALARVFVDFAPDAVMHLAAESHVDRSIAGPAAFITTNVL